MFSTLRMDQESLASRWQIASYSKSDTLETWNETPPAALTTESWHDKSNSILARWSSAYDVYTDIRGNKLTGEKRRGTATLRILKELGSTAAVLAQTSVDDPKDWDVFCPMFHNVVSLMEDIVEVDQNSTQGEPLFCVKMAIIGPLFKVSLL